ncbi:GNAT family N-acetyltransferase [Rhizobacter fulvus]
MQLNSPAGATGSRQPGPTSPADVLDSSEKRPTFRVEWARTARDVREAQRLRYQVFVGEMGAVLQAQKRSVRGHDIDPLDDFCEHLLVRADGARSREKSLPHVAFFLPQGHCGQGIVIPIWSST